MSISKKQANLFYRNNEGIEDDIKAAKEKAKKEHEAKSKITLAQIALIEEQYRPKNFDKYIPREGRTFIPTVTKNNYFEVPGAGRYNLADYPAQEYPNYTGGYPIHIVNDKISVGNDLFNKEFAQSFQRKKNSGDIYIQYGNKPVFKDGGEILELTNDEIQQYRDRGYIVEEY
jgi:hypothetical protein